MNNTFPFSFLESIATRFQPPAWVVDEGQQRLVLFLNHVLMQENLAQDRLLRQKGRVVHVRWGLFAIDLIVTPAGLADRAPAFSKPDLILSVAAESPLVVVQSALAGKAPPVKIEGDVQLAAELAWLAENLRWDAEEDLSRLIGDVPAHALADVGRLLMSGLKQFMSLEPRSPSTSSASSTVFSAMPERGEAPSRPGFVSTGSSAGSPQGENTPLEGGESDAVNSVGAESAPRASA